MARTVKITETPRQGLSAVNPRLGPQYEQIVDLLARRLGPAHARLFSEPVPVALAGSARAGLAWFADGEGAARPMSDLAEGERAQVQHEATRLKSEIATFADRLEREGEASRDLARLLRDALITPEGDYLWLVDDGPVLVAWGYTAAGASETVMERSGPITASAAAPLPPPRQVPVPPRPQSILPDLQPPSPPASRPLQVRWPAARHLLWIGVLVLGTLLGGRLLQACGVGHSAWPAWLRSVLPNHCHLAATLPDAGQAASIAAIRAVERDLHDAEIALTRRAAACEVSCLPPRAAATEPLRPLSPDVASRLEQVERGRSLELTLAWEGPADLDLFVTCPNQAEINFTRSEGCGARLVADQNRGGGTSSSRPIEHVIWNGQPTPEGVYRVAVALYNRHGEIRPSIPFRVVLSRNGQVLREETGQTSQPEDRRFVLSFTSPLAPLQSSRP